MVGEDVIKCTVGTHRNIIKLQLKPIFSRLPTFVLSNTHFRLQSFIDPFANDK